MKLYLHQLPKDFANPKTCYRVHKAVNTTEFKIGDTLSRPIVDQLCYNARTNGNAITITEEV